METGTTPSGVLLQTLLHQLLPLSFNKQDKHTDPERSAAAVYQNIQQLWGAAGNEGLVQFVGDGVTYAEQ